MLRKELTEVARTSPPTPPLGPRSAPKQGGVRGAPSSVARRPSATCPLLLLSDRVKPRSRRWRTATACARCETRGQPWGEVTAAPAHLHHASNCRVERLLALRDGDVHGGGERTRRRDPSACHAGGAPSVPALRDGAPGVRQGALLAQQAPRCRCRCRCRRRQRRPELKPASANSVSSSSRFRAAPCFRRREQGAGLGH
jgi:hypothetical protein